ncbi:hypothetical protein FRC11_003871 [Ceratobasidium sp. 423]|nr:hypothetical protein FRC11_003871 [Ceratobasidium sp. 423]
MQPKVPAPFPLLKTNSTRPWKPKVEGKAAAPTAKASTSAAKASTPVAKLSASATKPSGSSVKPNRSTAKAGSSKETLNDPEQVLEFVMPKPRVPGGKPATQGSKAVTQGTKHMLTSKETDDAPTKKKVKLADNIVDISSDKDGGFIAKLVDTKVAGNPATAAVINNAYKKIHKLHEELRKYKVKEEVQRQMKEFGVMINPDGSASLLTALTAPAIPAPPASPAILTNTNGTSSTGMMDKKFQEVLVKYLDRNNLMIVNDWEAYDPAHPFNLNSGMNR